jgi:hypothetical protein
MIEEGEFVSRATRDDPSLGVLPCQILQLVFVLGSPELILRLAHSLS